MRKFKLAIIVAVTLALSLTLVVALQAALGDRSLARRAQGQDVRELQTGLKKIGYAVGPIDGKYGRKTEAAVRKFQADQGIKVDGVAGPATIARLKKLTGAHTNAGGKVVGSSSHDQGLLARCITGEARGEPYQGQVAVGAVLLNRLKDSRFPKTIAGIIYQPGAFSSVNDGQINMAPSSSATRAARDAINGSDPSHGALYFFAPAKTKNRFIWSRPQIIQIGNHIFTK